jgi:hypothetical protein
MLIFSAILSIANVGGQKTQMRPEARIYYKARQLCRDGRRIP